MYRYQREWGDSRDGTKWRLEGVWPSTETLLGRIFLESDSESFDVWYVAGHGVDQIPDAEIEAMVDLARARKLREPPEVAAAV